MLWLTAPPKVDLSALGGREIRVRAGDPLKIDVPISGAPTPTVAWQKDGKELENSPRVCISLDLLDLMPYKISGVSRRIFYYN